MANGFVRIANLLQGTRRSEDLKLENVGRRGSGPGRRENVQSDITGRNWSNVVGGDALDVGSDARDRGEIAAINAHLNVEIARIQVEVVPSGAGMFHDESADAQIAAKIHLQKWIGG